MKLQKTLLSGAITAILGVSPALAANPPAANKDDAAESPSTTEQQSKEWNDRFFHEMRDIQDRLDALFSQTWREARENVGGLNMTGGFSSAVNLSEEGNNYVVRLTMPDRDIQNVDVRVESDNTLRVTAREEERKTKPDTKGTKKDESLFAYSMNRYEQVIGLPGPVDGSKMTIDRKDGSLTVTLPKK